MRNILILILITLSLTISSQELEDSTSVAIKSYFENNNSNLSSHFDPEVILDMEGDSYFSSFSEFDLFFRYVLQFNNIENWEYFHLENNHIVTGKSVDIIIFEFEVNDRNRIDHIYMSRKKLKRFKPPIK